MQTENELLSPINFRCAAVTAYNALNGPVPIKAGDTVLVLGTGGVSMCVATLIVSCCILITDNYPVSVFNLR